MTPRAAPDTDCSVDPGISVIACFQPGQRPHVVLSRVNIFALGDPRQHIGRTMPEPEIADVDQGTIIGLDPVAGIQFC